MKRVLILVLLALFLCPGELLADITIVATPGVALAPPTNVTASDGEYADRVVITWTKSMGATGYQVYRDDVGLGWQGDVSVYEDAGADPPVITAGNASASDGTHTAYVVLNVTGESASNGTVHIYKVKARNAVGESDFSLGDAGHRGTGPLFYQWMRSAADEDADYSDISEATTKVYNDTEGAIEPDGRYYKCIISMFGALSQNSTSDRGYRLAIVAPTVVAHNATDIGTTAATLNAEITDTGRENPFFRGFEWGYSSGNYSANWTETGEFGIGRFSRRITGLTRATEIFWRAFAANSAGINYSAESSFWTLFVPLAPTNFNVTRVDRYTANITWERGVGAVLTIIVGNEEYYPRNVTDGFLVYNGTGSNVTVGGLLLDTVTYYFRAWSWNEHGYSLDFADASIGGEFMMMLGMLLLPLAFTGFYLWKREMWQGIVTCLCWVIAAIFFLGQSEGTSPVDMADVWMGLFWVCMLLGVVFAFASFTWKADRAETWEDEEDSFGQPIKAQYLKGWRTGKTRQLTELELKERERQKEEARKQAVLHPRLGRPSRFSETGELK